MKKIVNIKLISLVIISLISLSVLSLSTFAQFDSSAPLQRITDSVSAFGTIVNTATIIVVALAFLYFFYNLSKYILKESGREEAKVNMGYAVIAMIVITSLWGIIAFVRSVVGIDAGESNNIVTPGVEIGNTR